MALTLANRVRETTTTTGTGTVTLAGAVTGYQAFSVIGNANTTYYTISGQGTSEFEVGIGTYTLSGTTLSRDTVLASSNGGSLVNFSAGTKDAFVTYPSNKAVYLDASGNASALGTPASGVVTNLTGTASININGTVGATTPGTGAFTTGTFSSTLAAGNTTITGTQTISGAVSSKSMLVVGSGGSTSAGWHLGNFSSGVSGLWSTTITPSSTNYAFIGTSSQTYVNAVSSLNLLISDATVGAITSTGLTVTGTLSATGTLSTTGGAAKAEAAASQAKSTVGAFNSGAAVTASAEILTFAQAGTQRISHFWAQNSLRYQIQTLTAGHTIALSPDTGNTDVLVASSTGVAVTGTLSATTGAAVGGATAGAGGLAFPATAVAVADANTLDDYEEGTWTPSIGGNATYTTQSGIYTRIGNQVTVGWEIEISVKGTGSATIMSGLPFTNRNGYYPAAPLSYWGNLGSSVTFIGGQVQPNGTTMNFTSGNASSTTCSSPTTVFANSTRVMGSVTYIV